MNPELAEVNPGQQQPATTGAAPDRSDGPSTAALDGCASSPRGEIAPHWFELLALAGVVALGTVGAVGLLLAIAGHYTTAVALGIGLPLTAAALVALHRSLPQGGTSRSAQLCAAAALLLAVGYGAFAGLTPSQNVVVTRDPGSYASTGRWLARAGTLEVDARGEAFAGVRGLRFSGPAVYDVGKPFPPAGAATDPREIRQSGHLELQFNHLAAVALAAGYDVGGYQLMFRVPALISALGLLLLYAVTARVTRRPAISLLAPALLGASMPLLYVARNTYSESFALALLWGALLVLIGVHERPRIGAAITGGVLLGALVCARVDSLLYVCMVFPLAAVSIGAARTRAVRKTRIRTWAAAIASAGAVGAIGWYDLSDRTGFYVRDLDNQLSPLRIGLVGAAVASLAGLALWMFAAPIRRFAERVKRPVAIAVAALVAAAMLFGWLVRPHLETAETSLDLRTVQILQVRDGLDLEPSRSYAEDSLRWMAWYLGAPALLAAIGGLTCATWRAIRARADAATLTLLVLCLGAGALYWYDPNITPDQLWATRRFIPATFPALTVWAAAFVATLASTKVAKRVFGARPYVGVAAFAVAALVLLVPPVLTTAPLRWQRIQPGYLKPILEACDDVGPNGAIIVLGGYGGSTLPQTLRGWCGVPVAAQGSAVSPAKLPALAAQIRANGRDLYLVSPDINDFNAVLKPGGPKPFSSAVAEQKWMAEQTLDRPPSHYVDPDKALADPVPTPFGLHVLKVDAG